MIHRSYRHRLFTRRLLEVMGLGSFAGVALAGAACGGTVIDGQCPDRCPPANGGAGTGGTSLTYAVGPGSGGAFPVGTGGAGGFNSSVSVVVSVGVGGAGVGGTGVGGGLPDGGVFDAGGGCFVEPGPQETVLEGCFGIAGGSCPAAQSATTVTELSAVFGLCNNTTGACCGQTVIADIPCGPFEEASSCCYIMVESPSGLCSATGRPFTVAGTTRTAPAHQRTGWSAPASPAVSGLDAGTRRALAEAWTREARYEHASVASFARLALELLAVGAPAELVRDAQRAMGDEIQHAERCFALASAYVGSPIGPGPLPLDGALERITLEAMAAAAVREGCIGETLAALAAAEARDATEDPAVRAALDAIARDEAEHAAMSWRLTAWAFRTGGAAVREAIAAAFAAPVDLGSEAAPEGVDASAFRAHGRLLPAELRAHAERALAEVIRPSAAALLASA